jgi:hypothetical protein
MKPIVKKPSQSNAVKIKHVVFVLKQYGIEMAISVLVCWKIVIIFFVWNVYEHGVRQQIMNIKLSKLG